ncbi:SOS response-associated peptidase [Isachenkonia alkalipeptolytica]|nr:SOS response-associated peptidase [Isachenkonia alkalipeptolytica]
MCGRYHFEPGDFQDLLSVIKDVEERLKVGEIFPTNEAPVILGKGQADLYHWGFPNFRNKRPIINARSESVAEKPMFQKSFKTQRCIIPASGFYEWDSKDLDEKGRKRKYLFQGAEAKPLYLAGIWRIFDRVPSFVILTTEANPSIEIHHRMPVIIPKTTMYDWIADEAYAREYLQREMPDLKKTPV